MNALTFLNFRLMALGGNELLDILSREVRTGENEVEILIDKTVAEIFINKGERYIVKKLLPAKNNNSIEFTAEKYGPALSQIEVYEMNSIWKTSK